MHELSIAISLLDLAAEEAERRGVRGVRVVAIHLRLGDLSGVVKEALLPAYQRAREGTDFAACRLVIDLVPVVVYCPACDKEGPVASVQRLCCPACGTPTPRVVRGRELEVTGLEVVLEVVLEAVDASPDSTGGSKAERLEAQ